MHAKVEEHRWLGDENESLFMCIDTPGLNDSEGDDEHHINEIIASMKKLDYVNSIVLVLNGYLCVFHRARCLRWSIDRPIIRPF